MTDLTRKYLGLLRAAQVQAGRFKDAVWYISPLGYGRGDPLNTIIYDAADLEGDGPNGHGMVCQGAVLDDARLIVQAPALLRIVRTLLAAWEYDENDDAKMENLMDAAIGMARATISKIDGEG